MEIGLLLVIKFWSYFNDIKQVALSEMGTLLNQQGVQVIESSEQSRNLGVSDIRKSN